MNNENKISMNDLGDVNGGAEARPAGMPCPQCNQFIPIKMEQVIREGVIACPHCGLRMNYNAQETKAYWETLKRLEKLNNQ